jgi:C-terminal processing protease CtpA/Prc
VYLVDKDITVIDIIKGSPGDIAGFKSGDVIISIDNDFKKNIQTFKAALQNAGARLKVLVIRDKTPIILTLNVKSILH